MFSATKDLQLQIYVLVCAIVLAICVFTVKCYSIPEPRFQQFGGFFRVSIPDTQEKPGISLFAFHGAVDRRLKGVQTGDFSGEVLAPTAGRWVYENKRVEVQPGQRIYYWIHIKHGFKRYRLLDKSYEFLDKLAYDQSITTDPVTYFMSNGPRDCEWSKTMVQGQKVCKGELIFEEDFDVLDNIVWKRDIRIPLDVDDGDFVVYQDRDENAYIDDGKLHIQPTRLDKVSGYSEATVRNGIIDLGRKCTGIVDRERECRRKAGSFQILPPIVSARINTKKSFSFRYGKIEIRAKLPKGDWLFPFVLDPLTSDYGMTGYQSGQMRVAYIRANEHLETKEGFPIHGSLLSFGIISTIDRNYSSHFLSESFAHIGNAFHTYQFTWIERRLLLKVDTVLFAELRIRGRPNPFNEEFYISLGLSAGGMSDFPDGCLSNKYHKPWQNGHPKAELHFWNARDKWYPTWNADNSSLVIDYIKVWAL